MPSSCGRTEHRTRLPSASCTLTATGNTSGAVRAQHFCPPASPWGLLEPDAWKRARPVLRGAGRSNAPGLPGLLVRDEHRRSCRKRWSRPAVCCEHRRLDLATGRGLTDQRIFGVMAAGHEWLAWDAALMRPELSGLLRPAARVRRIQGRNWRKEQVPRTDRFRSVVCFWRAWHRQLSGLGSSSMSAGCQLAASAATRRYS